ncbi:DNA helicase RecQ [Vibrio breoganii]|uniref:DNA helicase RecQ n=1 Tax=Vibrio breoganii TaxID=553239 RepID=UPI000C84BE2C|nr:DNA helicase RecQ [Vibrio breoganii]PMG89795.1 ATP-dependent DNA helicase RecQ [Vibrio breoganii]PML35854.1 ATP-dependent DNA helicase RecQ [Vibrio breoganii]PMM42028.1 ATP-dependent DNA helicase RecQ [Vibrio breoganii]PMM79741.1 ATP-dependent DNA helicase RecQ [Vibrio breoganii]
MSQFEHATKPQPIDVLNSVFGYDSFRHQQQAIVESVVQGQDVLTLMPTGGGKSICYQIPAMVRSGVGVVVSPLIALMKDQVDALRQVGVACAFLNSTQDQYEQLEVEASVMRGEIQLLYVSPERLLMERTLNLLEQSSLSLFAIDEAHCVSQWGHDFRPEYQKLSILPQRFPNVPRIALTATADERTKQEIIAQLHLSDAKVFVHSFDRPNIRYHVSEKANAKHELWDFIENNHAQDAGVIYCLSRKKVEETATWLADMGRVALPYHAGMSVEQKNQNQQRFLREDGVIIVATIAFGMGIDKPDVRFVAHLSLPKSIESYYQETGRAGRDGMPANAWMAYGLQDLVMQKQMVENSDGNQEYKQVQVGKLNSLLGYCELSACRRQTLLGYFGESLEQACGNCDNCLNPPKTWDGTQAAQKALSTVYRSGQRFGVTHLVNVLLGKSDDKIQRFGHDTLSTFGIGTELTAEQWKGVFRQLIAMNYLTVEGMYNNLRLTEQCRAVLKGEQSIELRELRKAKKKKSSGPKKSSALSAQDAEVFEKLRELRASLAKEQNVPAYVICHDASLADIALKRPTTLDALGEISGFGEAKVAKYGEPIITLMNQQPKQLPTLSATEQTTLELFQSLKDAELVAKERAIALNTVMSHLASAIELGACQLQQVIDIEPFELEEFDAAIKQLNSLTEAKLKPLFEHFDAKYDYGTLRCVVGHFAYQQQLATLAS